MISGCVPDTSSLGMSCDHNNRHLASKNRNFPRDARSGACDTRILFASQGIRAYRQYEQWTPIIYNIVIPAVVCPHWIREYRKYYHDSSRENTFLRILKLIYIIPDEQNMGASCSVHITLSYSLSQQPTRCSASYLSWRAIDRDDFAIFLCVAFAYTSSHIYYIIPLILFIRWNAFFAQRIYKFLSKHRRTNKIM